MREKDLKKLGRTELLEMLIQQTREVNRLRAALEEAEQKLSSREITIQRAGSIAEAALQLNGIFDAAQEAANQYLDNLTGIDTMEADTIQRCQKMLADTQAQCDEMVRKAKADSQSWWEATSKRMDEFYEQRPGLRDMLASKYKTQG